MRYSLAVVCVGAAAYACSSFEEGDATAEVEAGAEGGAADGLSTALASYGFELGSDCDAWNRVGDAAVGTDEPGRDGGRACVVCALPKGEISKGVPGTKEGTFRMTAWVKRAPDGGATNARITVQTNNAGGRATAASDTRALSTEWTRLEAATTSDGGTLITYISSSPSPRAACSSMT